MTNREFDKATGGWFNHLPLPQPHEKSIVLGGGKVLYPVADPLAQAEILAEYVSDVARRAFRSGQAHAKHQIRSALW